MGSEGFADFIARIESAFEGSVRPDPGRITLQQGVLDEDSEIAELLAPWTWQQLRDWEMICAWDGVFRLTPEAYAYFLPASLTAPCGYWSGPGVGVMYAALFPYTGRAPKPSEGFALRFRKLTFDQMMLCADYVSLHAERGDELAASAYEVFWKAFRPRR